MQLLYINLVTDGLPAIALAVAPKDGGIMSRRPRKGNDIFQKIDKVWLVEISILTAAIALFVFWIGQKTGNIDVARTFSFTAMILVQQLVLLDIRTKNRSFTFENVFKDKAYLAAFLLPIALHPLIVFVPSISKIFSVTEITVPNIVLIVSVSMLMLIFSEIRKQVIKRNGLY